MTNILLDFIAGERRQLALDGNALVKLAEFRFRQHIHQLELSDKHNLQQFRVMRLEVRENSYLFKSGQWQVLRLIDQENRAAVTSQYREQVFIQSIDKLLLVGTGIRNCRPGNAEVRQDRFQEIHFGEERVQEQRRMDILLDGVEHSAA